GANVVLVDRPQHMRMRLGSQRAPRIVVHRHATFLELRADTPVEENDLSRREAISDGRHAHLDPPPRVRTVGSGGWLATVSGAPSAVSRAPRSGKSFPTAGRASRTN